MGGPSMPQSNREGDVVVELEVRAEAKSLS